MSKKTSNQPVKEAVTPEVIEDMQKEVAKAPEREIMPGKEKSETELFASTPVKEIEKEVGINKIEYKDELKSTEEKIVGFLKGRITGSFIPVNDFLKSLYPTAGMNMPKPWHDQRTMKLLKITLDKMVSDGLIIIEGNYHQRLGKHHYPDTTTMITHYYNLDTLPLKAKLA